MKYNPAIHHRRSIRLQNYDYGQAGAYFITICTQGRECLLGEVTNSSIELSEYGVIVEQVWQQIPKYFSTVALDAAVIMPNHFHGIIVISDELINSYFSDDITREKVKKPTLSKVVAYFKYQSTKLINTVREMTGVRFWQRNYYEHVIRSEHSLAQLREYIEHNPGQWQFDQLHPGNPSKW